MWLRRAVLASLALLWATSGVHASTPIPCAGTGADDTQALASAEVDLRRQWRDAQPNWYTAFATRPPKRNPFDKSADETPTEPIKGVAWAQGLYCLATRAPEGTDVLVRYFARAIAFHEGQGWSRVFNDGMIKAYIVKRVGEGWQARAIEAETIMLPDLDMTVPADEAIPARDVKAGIPCRSGSVWNGKRCETVQTATR